jgi:hypothetical protein
VLQANLSGMTGNVALAPQHDLGACESRDSKVAELKSAKCIMHSVMLRCTSGRGKNASLLRGQAAEKPSQQLAVSRTRIVGCNDLEGMLVPRKEDDCLGGVRAA